MLSYLILVAVVVVAAVDGVTVARDISAKGTDCSHNGRVYKDGEIFRFFSYSPCVIMRCENGQSVEVRGDCTDSYGQCHPHGSSWAQGCKAYRCDVKTTTDKNGYTWTTYQPVKIRDC